MSFGQRNWHIGVTHIFDRLAQIWESEKMRIAIGYFIVGVFLISLIIIQLRRMDLLPEALAATIPTSHFYAINLAFYLLLIFEVVALVFSLAHSVAESVGKQFEILSLILLRSAFKEFIHFTEPVTASQLMGNISYILSDALGALLIFVFLGFYYAMQKHPPITKDAEEQDRFVAAKKLLSLVLLVTFIVIGLINLYRLVWGHPTHDFFSVFYTILIFSDILVVLISLRYSYRYCTLFRNSGFALATVFIRLALSADPYVNVGLGIGAALFALLLTYSYNRIAKIIA